MHALFMIVVLAACGATATELPAPATEPATNGEERDEASRTEQATAPWACDREGPEPVGDVDRGTIAALEELVGVARDAAALDARVDWTYWARWERAATLHAPDAPAPAPIANAPHRPEALAEILGLVPEGCEPIWVAGELRIDFPPAMTDTPPRNATEIEEVRRLAYEGQEVSAYCGVCAVFAVLFREEPTGGLTVLRAMDLRGWDEGASR